MSENLSSAAAIATRRQRDAIRAGTAADNRFLVFLRSTDMTLKDLQVG
jgi:hypothetical protein